MSDTLTEITLEDLDHYWTESGLPVFIANRDDICDVVETLGFSIYYLLGNNIKTTTNTTTNSTTKQSTTTTTTKESIALLKVVNNFVGRTVSISSDVFDKNILSIEEQATYNMPSIPHVIVDKLDQFFRLIDAQHGTESIVMLTYDTTKTGPDGWGILVPDQTNTSVHCNYDPHSVAVLKPDHVMIVGSVHSHPGMSAYASGTDHKDQADFDGLHITFGWQKSVNNGATQYHIELQMAGKAYTLQPEDVFEDYFVDKDPDPEVVEWSGKVKKVSPPTTGGMYMGHTPPAQQTTGATARELDTAPGQANNNKKKNIDNQLDTFTNLRMKFVDFVGVKFEDNAIIIAEVDPVTTMCPCCSTVIDNFILYNGYCDFCYMPFVEKNSTLEEIYEKVSLYCQDLFIDESSPVYLWTIDDDGTNSFMKILETSFINQNPTHLQVVSSVDDLDDYLSEDVLYCCGSSVDGNNCDCRIKITASDLSGFDHETSNIQLYGSREKCQSCEFYYDINCPLFKTLVEQWVNDPSLAASSFASTIDGSECDSYLEYSRLSYYESD